MNAKEVATKARDAIHGLIGISGTPEEMRAGEIAAAESIIAEALAEKDKEIARLREALSEIAGPVNHDATQPGDNRYQRIARAALLPPDEKKAENG